MTPLDPMASQKYMDRGKELMKLAELASQKPPEWMAAYLLDLAHDAFEHALGRPPS